MRATPPSPAGRGTQFLAICRANLNPINGLFFLVFFSVILALFINPRLPAALDFNGTQYLSTEYLFGAWKDILSPTIGLGTLLVAVLLWFTNAKKNWEASLEKKLTVSFRYEGYEIMRCEQAPLAHESDIRNWGQQLGMQMAGNNFLLMSPDFTVTAIIRRPENVPLFKEYHLTRRLEKLPQSMAGQLRNKGLLTNENAFTDKAKELLREKPLRYYDTPDFVLMDAAETVPSLPAETAASRTAGEPAQTRTIDVASLYAASETARLDQAQTYCQKAQELAGEGAHVILTGQGPVWLYLLIAHALHGKARSLRYQSPVTGAITIFNHDPS